MTIRRTTGLIVVGIAAILLVVLTFVGPALIRVDRYRPQVVSYLHTLCAARDLQPGSLPPFSTMNKSRTVRRIGITVANETS